MGYTEPTLKKLFALAGNECAFPNCENPVFDTTEGSLVGQICHIKGRSPGGPRYNPTQTEAERNGYENLLVMCGAHNKIVDDSDNVERYPVELLRAFKHAHESRSHNTTAKGNLVEQIVARLRPEVPSVLLTPVIEWLMTHPDNETDLDYYDFRVALRNDGPKPVCEFLVEVEIPSRYMQPGSSIHGEEQSYRPGYRLFRRTLAESMPPHVIHPRATRPVTQLGYLIKRQHYFLGIDESITVRVYAADELVSDTDYRIAEMLSAERVEMLLAPRMDAIRRLCQAAWYHAGENGDPTSERIYLSETPITPRPNARSIYVKDAYNMGKALERAGWLVFESEDAMSVRLTDEGVRVAS